MSQDLDKARRLVADGAHKRAVKVLWRVEANARTDLTEARGLLDLASACREHTVRGVQRQCELLVARATAAIERLSPRPAAGPPREQIAAVDPAIPAPLARLPPPRARSTISVTRGPSGTHDVVAGGLAVARVSPSGAQSSDERWQFARRRHGRSWRGVAETAGFDAAVAAYYYPRRVGPGGQLALADHSYWLQFRHLRGDWRLRDDTNTTLARMCLRKSSMFSSDIKTLDAHVEPACREIREFTLVLLFAIWVILLEQEMPQGGGGA